jgi:hypothetical protein
MQEAAFVEKTEAASCMVSMKHRVFFVEKKLQNLLCCKGFWSFCAFGGRA